MLTIRRAQVEALGEEQRRHFSSRLAEHVTAVAQPSGLGWTPDRVARAVDDGCARAAAIGLVQEDHVAHYVELTCRHEARLARDPLPPDLYEWLADERIPPAARLERLSRWLEPSTEAPRTEER